MEDNYPFNISPINRACSRVAITENGNSIGSNFDFSLDLITFRVSLSNAPIYPTSFKPNLPALPAICVTSELFKSLLFKPSNLLYCANRRVFTW